MTKEAVTELLVEMYQKRGFVTTDEIFNACDEAELSIFDTDYVSNKVIEKGALITDEQPLAYSDDERTNKDELTDYAQTDYSEIFTYFSLNYPNMDFIIDYIKSAKPLQHGEMSQLIMQIRSGNVYAKEIAFSKNIRLALKAAYNYRDKTVISLEDIFQQACISILKAIDVYDPYVHSAFTSYCSTWIMQGIERYIMDHENIIRIPVHLYERLNHIKKIEDNHLYLSRMELICFVSEHMGISSDEAEELISFYFLADVSSLDELFEGCEGNYDNFYNNKSIEDLMSCLSTETILYEEDAFALVDNNILRDETLKALSTLSTKENTIICLRYGLDGPEKTLEEVGYEFNVTRERIRQLEAKALRRLRHPSRSQKIRSFL